MPIKLRQSKPGPPEQNLRLSGSPSHRPMTRPTDKPAGSPPSSATETMLVPPHNPPTPTQSRRDLSNSFTPRGPHSSMYHLVRPSTTFVLLIGAVWMSMLTRYTSEFSSLIRAPNAASKATAASKSNSAAFGPTTRMGGDGGSAAVGEGEGAGTGRGEDPLERAYDNCIVGAGLSGSVIAENYASRLGQTSLIIEKRNHIGGNCYDYVDEDTGIRVSLFGAHLFHTRHERVWEYVQRFAEWVPYEHKVLGMVEGKHVPIPVTIDTVNILFDLDIKSTEEMDEWLRKEQVQLEDSKGNPREAINSEEVALTRVGPRLYDLIFKPYTFKQWAKYPAELGPEVLSRIPVRNNHDGRYFSDPHQALPRDGYTSIFERMLSSSKITVLTNKDYFAVKDRLKCKRLYYTGPIDTYFADLGWPKLEYRSLSFERVVQRDTPGYFQAAAVVNHPQRLGKDGVEVDYTRIVEYKHMLNQTSDHTIYFVERSKDGGEPYYPVPNQENKDLYKRYQEMAEKEEGVTFVGRLANYKYFNMDDAILNALELFDEDTKGMVKNVE